MRQHNFINWSQKLSFDPQIFVDELAKFLFVLFLKRWIFHKVFSEEPPYFSVDAEFYLIFGDKEQF